MERRRACIEALRRVAGSNDTNRDQIVRTHVKDCIRPEASDLRKQLQALAADIDAEVGTATGENWNYAKVFVTRRTELEPNNGYYNEGPLVEAREQEVQVAPGLNQRLPSRRSIMPDKRAPEYKEADRRTGADEVSKVRARAGVTGHNVRYVLAFGLLAVIVGFVIVYVAFVHR